MTYVISDIHGCYEKYMHMLRKISFSSFDTLYVLGDIVDRGPDVMKIVLDLAVRKNVITLNGNHDHEAFILLKNVIMPDDGQKADEFAERLRLWLYDGGITTYETFLKLGNNERRTVLTFLYNMLPFKELEIGNQRYFMSHTVPAKAKMLDFSNCSYSDFIIGKPEYEKKYFEDRIIITGHTPTAFIDTNYRGRIWHANNHIAVDCGAVFGNALGCICLETGEEFYTE